MTFRILLSPPDVSEAEVAAVVSALRSGWVAPAGPDLTSFEEEVAARVGVAHAVGLASGTAALHLTLLSWGVGPGDVVPVPTLTFAATANAVRYVGAEPHFVDSDPATGNLDPQLLRQALEALQSAGRRTPVVIPVDLFGKCADYSSIIEVACEHGAKILSDAAESMGATYQGRQAGAYGDAAVLSFNGNKIMTTSGGGMLVTSDERLAAHVRKLATQAREPTLHYEHTEIGFNYRLSNILAALGRAQLARLDDMLKRRREWRERYKSLFTGRPGVAILGGTDDEEDNCWLTPIVVDPAESSWTVADLASAMDRAGVEARPVWKPMHQQPVYSGTAGTLNGTADRLFADGLTLPSGSAMTEDEFAVVASVIEEVTSS